MFTHEKLTEESLCVMLTVPPSRNLRAPILEFKYDKYMRLLESAFAQLLRDRGITLLSLGDPMYQYWWRVQDNTILTANFEPVSFYLDKLNAEKYFDSIDNYVEIDKNVAIVMMSIRKYRLCLLSQFPREIITLIAKMVYLQSLEVAWEKVRGEINKELEDGKRICRPTLRDSMFQ
jgi:hypothetical protein